MSGVEALEQPSIAEAVPVTMEADLEAIWDRDNVTNGANRGDGGKFVSPNGEASTEAEPEQVAEPVTEPASLEGETGEEQPGSTPVEVPLPANRLLNSLDPEWATLSPEVQQKLTERSNELHTKLSQQGALVSKLSPLQDAASEFAEYFNGNLRGSDGQPINPADGIRYLANIQRSMDKQPLETLLSIADTYNLRGELAKAFGGQVQEVPQDTKILLSEIAELKRALQGRNGAAEIEQVIEQRELKSEARRLRESEPLVDAIPPHRWEFFVKEGLQTLGEGASVEAVFKYAVNAAVEADPALRAKTQAAKAANNGNTQKAENAKRATSVNVTSTSSGKARQPSLDDELEAVWDRTHKG
jgi:hypothetical protein